MRYTPDYAALVYRDSFALCLHSEQHHDPLDAILVLADTLARPDFHRPRFCRWCEAWTPGQASNGSREHDGLWHTASGRPRRPGSREPLLACGSCILGALDEVPGLPAAGANVQAAALRSQIRQLEEDPDRWQGRIRALRERLDYLERRQAEDQAAAELRAGKRRVLVQTYTANTPDGPPTEHWERVEDWDPQGVGDNRLPRSARKSSNSNHRMAALGKCIYV